MRDIRVSRGAVEGFSVPGATAARASDLLCVFALEINKKPSHRVAQWKGSSVPKGLASTAGFRYPVQPLHAQDRVV
jgi:hypothetical protein